MARNKIVIFALFMLLMLAAHADAQTRPDKSGAPSFKVIACPSTITTQVVNLPPGWQSPPWGYTLSDAVISIEAGQQLLFCRYGYGNTLVQIHMKMPPGACTVQPDNKSFKCKQ